MASEPIVIIGGGVGGLSAAIHLAARGVRVTLLERNTRVGGKLNLWEVPHPSRPDDRPFRFDTGPSLLTLPQVFDELFAAAGERLMDHLDLLRLDPIARFVWRDGTTFSIYSDPEQTLREVRRLAPDDVGGWQRLMARSREIWRLGEAFLRQSPDEMFRSKPPATTRPSQNEAGVANSAGAARPKFAEAFDAISIPFRIGMFQKFGVLVDRHIRSPRLREVLYQYATYTGASPRHAPATFACIPHAEMHFGGWYPRGGMYRVAERLEAVARKLGVTIRTGVNVRRILVEHERRAVRGVLLEDGGVVHARTVLANCDVLYTYTHLIDAMHRPTYSDRRLRAIEPGGSGMVLLLGVEGTYPHLAHHTKFMPADYRSDLRAMFETKSIPADPGIYVCATTRSDTSQAPEGCENLFVLVSAPPLDGSIDWAEAGPRYEAKVLGALEHACGLRDLSARIVVRRRLTPLELRGLYNAHAGSIYGIGSNSMRNAFLRPPNRDRDIAGLYFAGGATHPGGGLPLVALSGRIAARMIEEALATDGAPMNTDGMQKW